MREASEMPSLATRIKTYRGPVGDGRAQLLGFAELVIAGSFVIRDIRIMKVTSGEKGGTVFVAFPGRKRPGEENKYYDVAHPITSEAYQEATRTILRAYEEAVARA
ncbi:MAG: septation protein SpoVG family protein [Elusimicrobia bacterium]|nr:septation protein SpoVG family protein [Elusimicrobiota bacterium]